MKYGSVVILLCAVGCSQPSPDDPAPPSDGGANGYGGLPPDGAGGRPNSGLGGAGDDTMLRPRLVSSTPTLGATGVYPAPLWNGDGQEVVIAFEFSEPMTLTGDLVLEAPDHQRSVAEATWSSDGTQLTLFVRPDFSLPRPLTDETEYSLDTSSLVNAAGASLDPEVGLQGGHLVFTTGRYDALLNHSCGHTFFGPFGSVAVAATPDALAPDISTTHIQYTATLREQGAGYGGWLRAAFPTVGPYRLYFDAEIALALGSAGADPEAVALTQTPAACPGISYETTVHPSVGEQWFFSLGPEAVPTRRIIVELIPEK